ncbi:SAM-dependent methyltransferase [Shewanella sairae]|uniref:SAM-dependent methyltransferase n=1 Tax=Shewanella sairae TaxID=190310 RepID=A0ABQ4PRT6_9GAMM|nr:class I SAM-dependent methyltransferase [Shewanella sairae]MCL1132606.1 class I SAM-dependent methyltransferase [Shewanella sairae]GIU52553.1 SAM-dependent methyltransferase [Shewanella sairae]
MEPKIIASQLRCPEGEHAAGVAETMNDANYLLNQQCIKLLQFRSNDAVLEIGPGNGAFVGNILRSADNILYSGVDWSSDMVAEATRINGDLIDTGKAHFQQGSSDKLKFDNDCFDKVISVHTLYFWDNPRAHLEQIKRVLKPLGLFCLAFGRREFMQNLPFVQYGFELYEVKSVVALLASSGFKVIKHHEHQERGRSNAGDIVDKVVDILIVTSR